MKKLASHEYQSLGGGEYIPPKRGIYSAEADGINSVETASPYGDAKELLGKEEHVLERLPTTGNLLGKIETKLKSLEGKQLTETQVQELHWFRTFCEEVEDEHGLDGVGPWAQRLATDIDILLDEPEDEDDEPFFPEDRAVNGRDSTTTTTKPKRARAAQT